MHLEQFTAEGRLDADAAEELTWETTRYASRIHLTVGDRRVLAQNLAVCWDELDIGPGTVVLVEVADPMGDAAGEQRAIAGFVTKFQSLQKRPDQVEREPWLSRFAAAAHRRLR
ncbi:hypothetical protein [Gordonia neofelifaecis]|uniref:Uncharacterized protein n=1 Tax=Gordonia neofelifaecis NRRL B-59395 TaxID=644548 RepID=F1YF00_9ACTN|nr:hypothetical protein [Gordonia neofelifaecis]EGD56963.1 hypothetical protein SCNU_01255 [Gordonia neofelifaecis NRRL B-59395]